MIIFHYHPKIATKIIMVMLIFYAESTSVVLLLEVIVSFGNASKQVIHLD